MVPELCLKVRLYFVVCRYKNAIKEYKYLSIYPLGLYGLQFFLNTGMREDKPCLIFDANDLGSVSQFI